MQSQTCEDLHRKVMELQDSTRPLCIMDPVGDEIPEENINLCEYLYDGALLTSKCVSYKSFIIRRYSQCSFTIHVPPVSSFHNGGYL